MPTKINEGKRFEANFKKSVPSDVFCYRFRDGTANFRGGFNNPNVRFQADNICDFELFDGHKLILLELKTHKGKSLPLNCIRKNQIQELSKASLYKNVVAGVLVYFRDLEEVYYIDIDKIIYFQSIETRKSIPVEYFKNEGIKVGIVKKEVNILLNIEKFLQKL